MQEYSIVHPANPLVVQVPLWQHDVFSCTWLHSFFSPGCDCNIDKTKLQLCNISGQYAEMQVTSWVMHIYLCSTISDINKSNATDYFITDFKLLYGYMNQIK